MLAPLNDVREDDLPVTTSAQQVTIASDELLTIKNIGTVRMPYGTTSGCLDGTLSPGEARTFNASQYIKAASVGRQSTIARVTKGQVSVPGAVASDTDVRGRGVNLFAEGIPADGSDVTSDLRAALADPAVQRRGIHLPNDEEGGAVYGISGTLPLTTAISFGRFATIKAVSPFTGPMIDTSRSGTGAIATQRTAISGHPILDANLQAGVFCIGSADGVGSPNAYFGPMTLANTVPGLYAIAADAPSGGVGALVGTTWEYLQFENCAQWMNFGIVADDIVVQNWRGNMMPGNKPTGPVLRLLGSNISLRKGYVRPSASDMNSSGKCVFAQVGSNPVDIGRVFFEPSQEPTGVDTANPCNFTHIVWPINPSCDVQLELWQMGWGAPCPSLRAFVYLDQTAASNRLRRRVRLRGISRAGTAASSWVLNADVAAGGTTLPVPTAAAGYLRNGSQVIVDSGTPIEEVVTISDYTTSPPTCSAFVYPHASGAAAQQHMPLVEIRHNNGVAASGARVTLGVEDCDEYKLGVTDTSSEGFSSDSSLDQGPAVLFDGRHRGRTLSGMVTPAGGFNGTFAPADRNRSLTAKREHARRLLAPTGAIMENYERSDCGSNVTLTSGTLHLTEGGVLDPDDAVPTAIEFASGTSTSGSGMTQTSMYIVRRSDRVVLARSAADATATWSAAGITRRLNLDPVARGTGDTTNGSKTISNVARADRYLWRKGDVITGTGIPANTKVTDVDLGSGSTGTLTISKAATADGTGVTLNATGVRPSSLTAVYLGILVIGTTPPTLTGRGGIRGLLANAPIVAGNSTSGLSDRLAVGATADAPTGGSGGVNPAWAALY